MNNRHLMIGLTYDLRDQYLAEGYTEMETAEFDRADTIDEIENAIRALGHMTDRIGNAKELLQRLAGGDRWDLVFNICEGLRGIGREAQVPTMLDLYEIPYTFADPCVMSVCLDKAITKCVVGNAGVPTPNHTVVRDSAAVATLAKTNRLKFPLFAKPIAEGTGKGVTPASRVKNLTELRKICTELLAEFKQPVLVEEYLPGRELTVGLIGTGPDAYCLGTLEIILLENAEAEVYSYVNKEYCEELVKYVQVNAADDETVCRAEKIAIAAWRALGCRDGGRIDIRCDAAGNPQFIEANPLAGLHPLHSDLPMLATALGIPYVELIGRIIDSAATRCGKQSLHHHFGGAGHKNGKVNGYSPSSAGWKIEPLKIVVLHNEPAEHADVDDSDVLVQRDAVTRALQSLGHEIDCLDCNLDLETTRVELLLRRPDLVFNLVESLGGTDRLIALAPMLLEAMGIPFTGASSTALLQSSNKLVAKRRLRSANIPTPAWFMPQGSLLPKGEIGFFGSRSCTDFSSVERWIIKPILEHASLGMKDDSVVRAADDVMLEGLIRQREMVTGRPHFAEQFVEGREFNLSVLNGTVLPAAEIDFVDFPAGKPHIVGHLAKWNPDSFEYQKTPRRFDFPVSDRRLLQKLSRLSSRCWVLFELEGYARVDFRVDESGHPLVLEVNSNPCLSPDAGFAAALANAGISFCDAIDQVVNAAVAGKRAALLSRH